MVVFGIYITDFYNCIPLFDILFEDYKVVYDSESNNNQKLDIEKIRKIHMKLNKEHQL